MAFKTVSKSRNFGGTQIIHKYNSTATGTPMRLAVYLTPQAVTNKVPVLWFLSGLTCTKENLTMKAGAQRIASELGLILIARDTSPRGDAVPDDPDKAFDFGLGTGFYMDATEEPWMRHYRMVSYIADELPRLVSTELPTNMTRQGIMGHSMSGHGALTLALRYPGRFKAVSAFAPNASPVNCSWA